MMSNRSLHALVALAVAVASCGGGNADSETTTTASTPSTTTMAPTTTTTTLSLPSTVADIARPTDLLDGFRFVARIVDLGGPDGPDGLVTEGVFVAPDAVSCLVGDPASFAGQSLGTITAIGTSGWFDDGFGTPDVDRRSDDFVLEGLEICPGAVEFWEAPLFSGGGFDLGEASSSEDIEGFPVTRIDLVAVDDDVVLETAAIWVTEAGWPIRLSVAGSAPGGSRRFIGVETDEHDLVDFELSYELSGIDEAGLSVRAPDGSTVAGPIGDYVAQLPEFEALAPEILAAIRAARGTDCATGNLQWITMEPLRAQAGLGHISRHYEDPELPGVNFINTLTFAQSAGYDSQIFTTADEDLAKQHADLYFTHLAPVAVLFGYLGPTPDVPLDDDGLLDFAMWAPGSGDGPPERVATWDGMEVTFADGTRFEASFFYYLHVPPGGDELGPSARVDAWARAEAWIAWIEDALTLLPDADPIAVANLEALVEELDYLNALGCALLGSSVATIAANEGNETVDMLFAYSRAQAFLLYLDYVGVMVNYMELGEVDWLTADGLVLRNDEILPDDSAGEYLSFMRNAMRDALQMVEDLDI